MNILHNFCLKRSKIGQICMKGGSIIQQSPCIMYIYLFKIGSSIQISYKVKSSFIRIGTNNCRNLIIISGSQQIFWVVLKYRVRHVGPIKVWLPDIRTNPGIMQKMFSIFGKRPMIYLAKACQNRFFILFDAIFIVATYKQYKYISPERFIKKTILELGKITET